MIDLVSLFSYEEVKYVISWWNKEILRKGKIDMDDLTGLFCYKFPYSDSLVWTDTIDMNNIKRGDYDRYWVLMVPEPKTPASLDEK